MNNLYKIYGLKYREGWKFITTANNYDEVNKIADNTSSEEYARLFIVMHSFKCDCDIPMDSIDLKTRHILKKTSRWEL